MCLGFRGRDVKLASMVFLDHFASPNAVTVARQVIAAEMMELVSVYRATAVASVIFVKLESLGRAASLIVLLDAPTKYVADKMGLVRVWKILSVVRVTHAHMAISDTTVAIVVQTVAKRMSANAQMGHASVERTFMVKTVIRVLQAIMV